MAAKGSERKGKGKELKSAGAAESDINERALMAFTLPDSLSCSEIEFPILIKRRAHANWKNIIEESDKWHQEINEYVEAKAPTLKPPFQKTEYDYIKDEILVHLIPALVETLKKAHIWDALVQQKCFFNGIDHISQVLWNNNPRYPGRKDANLHLFNMPWVINRLKVCPRPYYPKSWLWTDEYAATLIQKTVRQFFIQKQEEVQEMRVFWRKLEYGSRMPNMDMNPLLAKKFASSVHISNKHL